MTLKNKHHHKPHVPVLLDAVLEYLGPQAGESYLDLTAGYGGHAEAVLSRTTAPKNAVLIDRDELAIKTLQAKFGQRGTKIVRQDYASAVVELHKLGQTFDMILADLGVSSPQLDIGERGFSLGREGPLDMRMDQRTEVTAATLVNTLSERELIKLLREYGEEPRAAAIAKAIVGCRPVHSTSELADITATAIGRRKGKIHPATRTFQALRIAVNEELTQLRSTLELLPDLLTDGGRLVIISFHSLEDRLVKQFVHEYAGSGYDAELRSLTKRPVQGTLDDFNRRARSAKLRAVVKIKNKRKEPTNANTGKG